MPQQESQDNYVMINYKNLLFPVFNIAEVQQKQSDKDYYARKWNSKSDWPVSLYV